MFDPLKNSTDYFILNELTKEDSDDYEDDFDDDEDYDD